jgi:hypothetical protein
MERPIIFNDAMVRAILSGAKTETRRPVKPQPATTHSGHYIDAYCGQPKTDANPRGMSTVWTWWLDDGHKGADIASCPFGVPGDTLWVRECFTLVNPGREGQYVDYRASADHAMWDGMWKPSIHMPRWAARTVLDVLEVRVERLQDMSEEDARAEGFETRAAFCGTWDAIYPTMGMRHNPWVWVVRFRRQGGA